MNNNSHRHFFSIILSAGLSTRMKSPKIILPWGDSSVLGTIISEFRKGGINDIVVVTGGFREEVEEEAVKFQAQVTFNPNYANGEMIDSLKTGISFIIESDADAVFIALGDQPGIHHDDILQMQALYAETKSPLIIPSYNMRRGHPWLVARSLWSELLSLDPPRTMRDFIESNKESIRYYNVQKSNILDDLDTPEDYQRLRPK